MEDDKPSLPSPVATVAPPSATDLANAATAAQVQNAPALLASNQQVLPGYAQLQTDIMGAQAPQQAQINQDIQNKFGPQLVNLALQEIKQSDPTGFALREASGNALAANIASGGTLTPAELARAQDQIRSGQAARGMGSGIGDVQQEALALDINQRERQQQDLAAANQFLNSWSPEKDINKFVNPQAPVSAPNVNQFASTAPSGSELASLGMQSANLGERQNEFASNYGMESAQYIDQNTSNPFLTGLAAAGSFAAPIIGGMASGGAFNAKKAVTG